MLTLPHPNFMLCTIFHIFIGSAFRKGAKMSFWTDDNLILGFYGSKIRYCWVILILIHSLDYKILLLFILVVVLLLSLWFDYYYYYYDCHYHHYNHHYYFYYYHYYHFKYYCYSFIEQKRGLNVSKHSHFLFC